MIVTGSKLGLKIVVDLEINDKFLHDSFSFSQACVMENLDTNKLEKMVTEYIITLRQDIQEKLK